MNLKIVVALALAASAVLVGCRREVYHEPMKLGADVAVEQAAR